MAQTRTPALETKRGEMGGGCRECGLRSRPGWAATQGSQQTHSTGRLLVALSHGYVPRFLLCDFHPLLVFFLSML